MSQQQTGPDIGSMMANAAHTKQHHEPHAAHVATAQDISLGEHPVKMPGAIPTVGGGSAIQLPGGVEGHGALSDTAIDLGNSNPFGLPSQAFPGLHQTNNMGDVGADKIGPGPQLNAMNDHGLDVTNAVSSNVGGQGH